MARGTDQGIPEAIRQAVRGKAAIALAGEVDKPLLDDFLGQLADARQGDGDIVLTLTTLGGDADLARRFMLEIDRVRGEDCGRFLFLGKSSVYSAGISIMSAFPPGDRYLTKDCLLMIHDRELIRTIELDGSIRAGKARLESLLSQLDTGIALEEEAFRRLVDGTPLALEDVIEKAGQTWYLTAEEALEQGMVAGVV